jgi:hypothetical protein
MGWIEKDYCPWNTRANDTVQIVRDRDRDRDRIDRGCSSLLDMAGTCICLAGFAGLLGERGSWSQ